MFAQVEVLLVDKLILGGQALQCRVGNPPRVAANRRYALLLVRWPGLTHLRSAKQGSPFGQFFFVASNAEQGRHGKVSESTGCQI